MPCRALRVEFLFSSACCSSTLWNWHEAVRAELIHGNIVLHTNVAKQMPKISPNGQLSTLSHRAPHMQTFFQALFSHFACFPAIQKYLQATRAIGIMPQVETPFAILLTCNVASAFFTKFARKICAQHVPIISRINEQNSCREHALSRSN